MFIFLTTRSTVEETEFLAGTEVFPDGQREPDHDPLMSMT